jgi:hypothetical protein
MPALTRRRSDNPHQITWHVYYGDVHVGTIGERAGVPIDRDQWQWSCGFYPGLHPRQHRYGTAANFDEARLGFEADWKALLPDIFGTGHRFSIRPYCSQHNPSTLPR